MTRSLPSDRQLDDLLGALTALTLPVGKGDEQELVVEVLARRVRAAVARDRSGSAIPDGYPRGSSAEGGSTGMARRTVIDPETGEEASQEFTSVELAYMDRDEATKKPKDHHRELTRGAVAALDRAVRALDDLTGKLAGIDNLIDRNPNDDTALRPCRSHARVVDGLGRAYLQPVDRALGGRDGLCRWCFGWMHDTENNPGGTLPPVALVERLIRHGRITSRDIAEVRAATQRQRVR